ncbi:MAG: hypothetical protein A3H95_14725 [Acidobacteria bacterium RIFCSPLOWO2_02_FULL_64_15]|nr:MAG: hypothetical protein A3H95_14725 [Acidobacteria bacterium RIFCSPLOWO2_02_FULL_64_15]
MRKHFAVNVVLMTGGLVAAGAIAVVAAMQQAPAARAQTAASQVAVDADDIGGIVTGPNGPEAGVWVIAETTDLGTTFRKIVVTDDRGRYVIPDLPRANYRIWVRGYGLVDSAAVQSATGRTLALTAVPAPDAKAAAHYYPGNYWLSLMQIPPKSAFPITVPAPTPAAGAGRTGGGARGAAGAAGAGAAQGAGRGNAVGGAPAAAAGPTVINDQGEWIFMLKRGCQACHQMGLKATREIPASLGTFDSTAAAWERLVGSGQTGAGMLNAVNAFGHERGMAMFADWVDRIAAGETPQAPPRPSGAERNIVISLWDWNTDRAFVHDAIATNKLRPTINANGPVFGPDWSAGALAVLDPTTFTKGMIPSPMTVPSDRANMRTWSPQTFAQPSLFWGNEVVWTDPINSNQPHMDTKGRVWYRSQTRADQLPFCRTGSENPFAANFPQDQTGKGLVVYDPKTNTATPIDLCYGDQHSIFADDPDETLFSTGGGGIGWFKTRVWDETHDAQKAQGWCPAVLDYNGDGKTGPWTRVNEPPDPMLDRAVAGANGYGIAFNPVDKSLWIAAGTLGGRTAAVPGRLIRITPGANPPATCLTEVFEPPYKNPKAPGVEAFWLQGVDIDTNGIVWAALTGSNQLAAFDRSKCAVKNGPTATGQQCPEAWTLYPVPGPTFKGVDAKTDFYYFMWMDRDNTLGLGSNVPVINGTGSDSLIAFKPDTKEWVTIRVPYPLGFYTRGMDGRIDDPNAGWKGRGLWAANNDRVVWLHETGKGTTSQVAHVQLRPNPLAK